VTVKNHVFFDLLSGHSIHAETRRRIENVFKVELVRITVEQPNDEYARFLQYIL